MPTPGAGNHDDPGSAGRQPHGGGLAAAEFGVFPSQPDHTSRHDRQEPSPQTSSLAPPGAAPGRVSSVSMQRNIRSLLGHLKPLRDDVQPTSGGLR